MGRIPYYSAQEHKFIRENYLKMNYAAIGKIIGRSEASISAQVKRLGLRKEFKKHWTAQEIEQLRVDAKIMARKEIAAKFGVTDASVKMALKTHNIKTGRTGRFTKGNVPWTKGKKMPKGWGGTTRFKKGNHPHNALHVGDIIVRKYVDGYKYKWIKVAEPNLWRPFSHVVYEQHHGIIPEGYFIRFKDGNTLNCHPANLEPESKQEHMRRNTIARFPPELISTIHLLSKFKRKVKSYAEEQD